MNKVAKVEKEGKKGSRKRNKEGTSRLRRLKGKRSIYVILYLGILAAERTEARANHSHRIRGNRSIRVIGFAAAAIGRARATGTGGIERRDDDFGCFDGDFVAAPSKASHHNRGSHSCRKRGIECIRETTVEESGEDERGQEAPHDLLQIYLRRGN